MSHNILIAFDDSQSALRAVELVASQFKNDNRVTLFSVTMDTAALCKMNSPELTPYFKSEQNSFCLLEDKKKDLVGEALIKAKDMLKQAGFSDDQIQIKVQTQKSSVAKDILDEAEPDYDIIVMGRNGKSGVKEFFLGSTPLKVFNHAKDISLLVVD
jgi:nucleotide-binding universal stress UspA family protein